MYDINMRYILAGNTFSFFDIEYTIQNDTKVKKYKILNITISAGNFSNINNCLIVYTLKTFIMHLNRIFDCFEHS